MTASRSTDAYRGVRCGAELPSSPRLCPAHFYAQRSRSGAAARKRGVELNAIIMEPFRVTGRRKSRDFGPQNSRTRAVIGAVLRRRGQASRRGLRSPGGVGARRGSWRLGHRRSEGNRGRRSRNVRGGHRPHGERGAPRQPITAGVKQLADVARAARVRLYRTAPARCPAPPAGMTIAPNSLGSSSRSRAPADWRARARVSNSAPPPPPR